MKNILNYRIKLLIAFFGSVVLLSSCEYQKIADATYPDPVIYMPAATNGIFTIDNVPQRAEFLPTPGYAYRFKMDLANNKFIVPLGVYRSGLDHSGTVTANIAVNMDTITNLLAISQLPAETGILPSSKFSVPASVDIPSGAVFGDFNLSIDVNYLKSFADTIFALGVGITSSQLKVNPLYKTTILVLYTKILKPTADFSTTIDDTNHSKVTFTNTSTFQMKNLWNFGDGKTDTVKAPIHIYAAPGSYNVSLTAVGVLGTVNQSVKTVPVTIVP